MKPSTFTEAEDDYIGKMAHDSLDDDPVRDLLESLTINTHADRVFGVMNPAPAIIAGYIFEGTINLNVAIPGEGKTLVAAEQAYTIASGDPFAGRETTKGSVLYICTDSPDDTENRISAIHPDIGNNIITVPEFPRLPEGMDVLEGLVGKYLPKIVVLDTWDSIRTHDAGSWASQDAAIEYTMEGLRRIAREYKLAFIINHHATRADNGRARGSLVLDARSDTIALVSCKDKRVSLRLTKNRKGPRESIGQWDIQSEKAPNGESVPALRYVGNEDNSKHLKLQKILAAINEGGTQREIAARADIAEGSRSKVFTKLKEDGLYDPNQKTLTDAGRRLLDEGLF